MRAACLRVHARLKKSKSFLIIPRHLHNAHTQTRIDWDDIESAFIQQILDWPAAGEVIAEMFFEKHYVSADMMRHFGTPATDYPGALRLMQSLRAHGVRAHFWP